MKFDIVTFGSAVVDMFMFTDAPEINHKVVYPVGSKVLAKDFKLDIGGGGTNTATAFARLGLKTGFIGVIGDDRNSEAILDLLKKEKIAFLGQIEKNSTSGCSVILDSREHNRTILTYKGINNKLKYGKIKKFSTGWLYYSSLLGKSLEAQIRLAKAMKKKGVKMAFNPSEYLIKKVNLKPLFKLCDVLIVNKEEARLLVKKGDLLIGLHKLGPKIVAITNKGDTVWASDGIKKYSIKPNKKVKVLERTGAGDAFASGFVAGLIRNKRIEKCLKLGVEESEAVIGHFGAKNKLIRRKL